MSVPPPLLRAPPFPWVAPERAAVSVPGAGTGSDPARLAALVAAIREARVGGDFWAAPAAAEGATVILRPRDPDEAAAFGAQAAALGGRARAVFDTVDPWSVLRPGIRLIAAADDEWRAVALLAGAEVVGLDADAGRALLADRLFAAAYRDPFTGAAAAAEDVVPILADWRRQIDANRAIAAATGIAWWKKQAIERFLWSPRIPPPGFVGSAAAAVSAAQPGEAIATWPARAPEGLAAQAAAAGTTLVSIEDGFIRSVGLGSDLHPPSSIVVDRGGIYYDPARPSDLETILATADFPAGLIERAARLRETIVTRGISKYASGGAMPAARRDGGRRRVLVAGQVEDDMSVRAAGGVVAGNLDLLVRARAEEPGAHILFKPHPDVDAGHRVGRVADAELRAHADEIVRGGSMAALLAEVDAVHVLTSQTGFEALLRGVETIVHGQPFYAGWGLTRDRAPPLPRRTRRLSLDQLVAGTLILYPRYLDPDTQLWCPPEILLERFARSPRPRRSPLILARQLQGRLARLFGTVTD